MTARTVIDRCAIATMDAAGAEHADGHVVIDGDRIVAVGAGPAPEELVGDATRRIDGRGRLATPGLVNCHQHLYQWATRGLAQQALADASHGEREPGRGDAHRRSAASRTASMIFS